MEKLQPRQTASRGWTRCERRRGASQPPGVGAGVRAGNPPSAAENDYVESHRPTRSSSRSTKSPSGLCSRTREYGRGVNDKLRASTAAKSLKSVWGLRRKSHPISAGRQGRGHEAQESAELYQEDGSRSLEEHQHQRMTIEQQSQAQDATLHARHRRGEAETRRSNGSE